MSRLILLQGLPSSGKSTKAAELLNGYGNATRLNRDLLREMLHCNVWSGKHEGTTKDAERLLAREFLKKKLVVIVDDTNLSESTLQSWKGLAKDIATVEIINLDTPWDVCIERDKAREKKVGAHVIIGMARKYGVGGYDMTVPEALVDCDGTVADLTHRLHYIQQEPKNWEGFFSNMSDDLPITKVINDVQAIYNEGTRIVMVSGRPERTRTDTEDWLHKHGVPFHVLFMRQNHDKRPDTDVKRDILHNYFNKDTIRVVFDDRPVVLRLWEEELPDAKIIDCGSGEEF